MSMIVNKTNGSALVTIPNSTVNTSASSLSLPGIGSLMTGLSTNTNLIRLLENFANSTAPANPLRGQLWFDTNRNVFKVYDGTSWNLLKSKLVNTVNLTLQGDVQGTATFDGNSDVTIPLTVSNSGIVAGSYNKVRYNGRGRATIGMTLSPSDISDALGYTPIDRNQVLVPGQIPLHGIMLWGGDANGGTLPTGFTICDGKTIACGDTVITTPDLRNIFPGGNPGSPNRIPYVMRVCEGAFSITSPATTQEWTLTVSSTVTAYNVLAAFTAAYGAPAGPVRVRVTVASGGLIGSTIPTTAALTVGQFPSGSTIIIDNRGSIQGAGGIGVAGAIGGTGGDAIFANYPNQAVIVNNFASGTILAGGGAGGGGGNGGAGYYNNCYNVVVAAGQGYCTSTSYFGGSAPTVSCTTPYGSTAYCAGGFYYCGVGSQYYCSSCYRTVQTCDTVATTGGIGGAGGRGQGYQQPVATGAAGAAGGTGAGVGGTGGAGGTWGNAGVSGSQGANGNNGSGTVGFAGGTGGRYLNRGSSNVIINNNGTVAGALA